MARKTIFPLVFKPGINRDLTPFETETCTDAFWMRWYGGRARSMGGQVSPRVEGGGIGPNRGSPAILPLSYVSDFIMRPIDNTRDIIFIAANPSHGAVIIDYATDVIMNAQLLNDNNTLNSLLSLGARAAPNRGGIAALNQRYMGTFVTLNGQPAAIFLGTNTKVDLFDNSAPALWRQPEPLNYQWGDGSTPFTKINNAAAGILPTSNGGLCYVAPYLFLYGSNGTIQYSSVNNPFNFVAPVAPPTQAVYLAQRHAVNPQIPLSVNADTPQPQVVLYNQEIATYGNLVTAYNEAVAVQGGSIQIAPGNEKVLFGSPVRGGANSPSVLFWTNKKVILISNVGDNTIQFRVETLSQSSSVMSSRCIIEYDGMFFWPGTKRFYVYNGIVGEMVNDMNRRFFFDNIDMARRQEVFGVYNEEFGELWWFYWDIQNNQRAIIYNKNTNTWYDTIILPQTRYNLTGRAGRQAGKYYGDRGKFFTFGMPLVQAADPAPQPLDTYTYMWLHNEDNRVFYQSYFPQTNINQFATVRVNSPINWYLVTPNISLAAATLNPSAAGSDSMAIIESLEPDIRVNSVQTYGPNPAPMTVKTYLTPYAQSNSTTLEGFTTTFFGKDATGQGTEKIDIQSQETNISFRFSGITKVQFGKSLLVLTSGDKNRSTLV